jgi:hypothetical protein
MLVVSGRAKMLFPWPTLAVLFERLVNNVIKLGGKIRIEPQQRCRFLVQDRIEDGSCTVATKGQSPRRHLVKPRAK